MCIVFTAAQGVSAAYIMKRLDNIVKVYAQSMSSILMTIASTVFFPLKFNLDYVFIASLILTIIAIFLNEHASLNLNSAVDGCQTYTIRLPSSVYGQYGSLLGAHAVFLFYSLSINNKPLSSDNKPLSADNKSVSADHNPLSADNQQLSVDSNPLPAEKDSLSADKDPLSADNQQSSTDNKPLPGDNNALSANNDLLFADNNSLSAENNPLSAKKNPLGLSADK